MIRNSLFSGNEKNLRVHFMANSLNLTKINVILRELHFYAILNRKEIV